MDLRNLIGKELIVKPDFQGSFMIHTKPEFEGSSVEMRANESLGVVKTFVKSKQIPGMSFIVLLKNGTYYYCNLEFLKLLYFSSLKGAAPEIIDSKKKSFSSIYVVLLVVATGLFLILRKK